MGGSLSLVAEFPGRDPVVLSGIAVAEVESKPIGQTEFWGFSVLDYVMPLELELGYDRLI